MDGHRHVRRAAKARPIVAAGAMVLAFATHGFADPYPPITNRDFSIDLYQGVVIGSTELIGQGGAGVASAEGSIGALFNPAAAAVRPTTATSPLRLSVHLDWLNPRGTDDLENSGIGHADVQTLLLTGGLAIYYREWALALTATSFTYDKPGIPATEVVLQSGKIGLAKTVLGAQLAVGAALRTGSLAIAADGERLFSTLSQALEVGALYQPAGQAFRLGGAGTLPLARGEVETEACDPSACAGYILPSHVELPPTVRLGGAYRFGPTPWNQRMEGRYRDERHYTVMLDLTLAARAQQGAGLGAFLEQTLQRSGQHVTLNVNAGVNAELIPGRLRVRAGSYWEAARLEDRNGRLHGTTGADLRLYAGQLGPYPFRLRLTATIDAASNYLNSGISVGFWP